jgi:hypothetical protein
VGLRLRLSALRPSGNGLLRSGRCGRWRRQGMRGRCLDNVKKPNSDQLCPAQSISICWSFCWRKPE